MLLTETKKRVEADMDRLGALPQKIAVWRMGCRGSNELAEVQQVGL